MSLKWQNQKEIAENSLLNKQDREKQKSTLFAVSGNHIPAV